jgi:uncharacterized Fe-S cluster-containing protein
MVPQGGSQTAQLFSMSSILHFIIHYHIQIPRSQGEKIDTSGKMLGLCYGRAMLARVGKRHFPVSESQIDYDSEGCMEGGFQKILLSGSQQETHCLS